MSSGCVSPNYTLGGVAVSSHNHLSIMGINLISKRRSQSASPGGTSHGWAALYGCSWCDVKQRRQCSLFRYTTTAACVRYTRVDIDSAISTVLSTLPHVHSLKDEQRTALEAFVDGNDVFARLPL